MTVWPARALLVLALAAVAWQSLVPVPATAPANVSDKVLHVSAYAVLGALAALSVSRERWWQAWLSVTVFGFAIEVLQRLTPTRAFEWLDLAADGVGAFVGVSAVMGVRVLRARTG